MPEWFASNFGFCNVDTSLHIDGDNVSCSWVGSLRRVSAYVLFALCWPSLVLGEAQEPSWPGGWWTCACVLPCCMCIPVCVQHPRELWYSLQNTPNLQVLAQTPVSWPRKSCAWSCEACSAGWWRFHCSSPTFPSQNSRSSLLGSFTGGGCVFLWGFPCGLRVCEAFGDRGVVGSYAGTPLGLWWSHNPVLRSWRSVSLVQKDVFRGFGWEGGDWNGSDPGTLRFPTNVLKSGIV